eukprot:gb/GECG01006582.1/.p1 GENE.gb/GECG01006582.1/~~gb/GECG01006582.1/.p1  ORF type:complete len:1176 (+),score=175.91 gb/GECG01006582.1/:1-3528(+)
MMMMMMMMSRSLLFLFIYCAAAAGAGAGTADSANLREGIISGGEQFFTYNETRKMFELTGNFVWKDVYEAHNNVHYYIALGPHEVFDGNDFTIDLFDVGNFPGLFTVEKEVTAFTQAPEIRNLHTKNGEIATRGGFIVQGEQRFFIVDSCSSSGKTMGGNEHSNAGGICGHRCGADAGQISILNSFSSGKINSKGAGGIAGGRVGDEGGIVNITNCHSNGVISHKNSGGIVGVDAARKGGEIGVFQCHSSGTISANHAGGICGAFWYEKGGTVEITQSSSTGNIDGKYSGGIIGGNAGRNGFAEITECYSTGDVNGISSGGIVGQNAGEGGGVVNVLRCHSTGIVKGKYAGGVCGSFRAIAAAGSVYITESYSRGAIDGYGSGGVIGAEAGRKGAVEIKGCDSTGQISGSSAGGIVGVDAAQDDGEVRVTQCYSSGRILGENAGGICGSFWYDEDRHDGGLVSITHSYSTGEIQGVQSGGIIGGNSGRSGEAEVRECYSTGNITGEKSGGITGHNTGEIDGMVDIVDCYSRGSISGSRAGGICGADMKGTVDVTNTYASGELSRNEAGGIIGRTDVSESSITVKHSVYSKPLVGGDGEELATEDNVINSDDVDDIKGQLYHANGVKVWSDAVWATDGPVSLPVLRFQLPTPCPTASTTASTSSSPLLTSTPSETITVTSTPTTSETPSGTSTRTQTAALTASPSSTSTASRSPTSTGTPSETGTGTPTPTSTRTPSESNTGTVTLSSTGTPSRTVNSAESATSTSTVSQTLTRTASFSSTTTSSRSSTPLWTCSLTSSETSTLATVTGVDNLSSEPSRSGRTTVTAFFRIFAAATVAGAMAALTIYLGYKRRNNKNAAKASSDPRAMYANQIGIPLGNLKLMSSLGTGFASSGGTSLVQSQGISSETHKGKQDVTHPDHSQVRATNPLGHMQVAHINPLASDTRRHRAVHTKSPKRTVSDKFTLKSGKTDQRNIKSYKLSGVRAGSESTEVLQESTAASSGEQTGNETRVVLVDAQSALGSGSVRIVSTKAPKASIEQKHRLESGNRTLQVAVAADVNTGHLERLERAQLRLRQWKARLLAEPPPLIQVESSDTTPFDESREYDERSVSESYASSRVHVRRLEFARSGPNGGVEGGLSRETEEHRRSQLRLEDVSPKKVFTPQVSRGKRSVSSSD